MIRKPPANYVAYTLVIVLIVILVIVRVVTVLIAVLVVLIIVVIAIIITVAVVAFAVTPVVATIVVVTAVIVVLIAAGLLVLRRRLAVLTAASAVRVIAAARAAAGRKCHGRRHDQGKQPDETLAGQEPVPFILRSCTVHVPHLQGCPRFHNLFRPPTRLQEVCRLPSAMPGNSVCHPVS